MAGWESAVWGCGRGQRDFLSARDDDQAVVPGPLASVSTTSLASKHYLVTIHPPRERLLTEGGREAFTRGARSSPR